MQLLKALWALAGAALCCFLVLVIHAQFLKEGQLAAGTCEIVTLDRDSSQPRRTIARQTARCACRKGQIAGTTRARPACVDARIIRTKQWCDMLPCLEGEGCDLLINRSGWTCTQPGGRIKTTTMRPVFKLGEGSAPRSQSRQAMIGRAPGRPLSLQRDHPAAPGTSLPRWPCAPGCGWVRRHSRPHVWQLLSVFSQANGASRLIKAPSPSQLPVLCPWPLGGSVRTAAWSRGTEHPGPQPLEQAQSPSLCGRSSVPCLTQRTVLRLGQSLLWFGPTGLGAHSHHAL
ncbi:chemokine-like protein TAFA-5 isoform X2 [Equus asinus]|uniref:chemokine-like protein TAFA-5 isoform X2 n=1 Tax=Equus asinus TaxID=9793 RepID=UPI0038F73CF1